MFGAGHGRKAMAKHLIPLYLLAFLMMGAILPPPIAAQSESSGRENREDFAQFLESLGAPSNSSTATPSTTPTESPSSNTSASPGTTSLRSPIQRTTNEYLLRRTNLRLRVPRVQFSNYRSRQKMATDGRTCKIHADVRAGFHWGNNLLLHSRQQATTGAKFFPSTARDGNRDELRQKFKDAIFREDTSVRVSGIDWYRVGFDRQGFSSTVPSETLGGPTVILSTTSCQKHENHSPQAIELEDELLATFQLIDPTRQSTPYEAPRPATGHLNPWAIVIRWQESGCRTLPISRVSFQLWKLGPVSNLRALLSLAMNCSANPFHTELFSQFTLAQMSLELGKLERRNRRQSRGTRSKAKTSDSTPSLTRESSSNTEYKFWSTSNEPFVRSPGVNRGLVNPDRFLKDSMDQVEILPRSSRLVRLNWLPRPSLRRTLQFFGNGCV